MSKHKKQHYIPRCYLKSWTDITCPEDQEPYIWVFPKEERQGRRKAPSNVFHETDMYTINRNDGKRDLTLEHGLKELEDRFVSVRDKCLSKALPLSDDDHMVACAFTAAMHARTVKRREHIREQWAKPLRMMDDLIEVMKTASPEQKRAMASISPRTSSSERSMSYEQVKALTEDPLRYAMVPMIIAEVSELINLDFAVLVATEEHNFITSDSPCVWFDPKSHTRPPIYRAPALIYPTLEITLPVSPRQCIVLNQMGFKGYLPANDRLVTEFNRRTRFYAYESYINNKNYAHDRWFAEDELPEDSWEKIQERKMKGEQATQ